MSKTITILKHQSLMDISLQETGSIEAVFEIALANNFGITSEIVPGTKLKIKQEPVDARIFNYFKNNKILPATGKLINDQGIYSDIYSETYA